MTQILVIVGIAVLGMLLGFIYHMLGRIEKNIEKLFNDNEKVLALYNDLDRRIIVLETKAKERRHLFEMEETNG